MHHKQRMTLAMSLLFLLPRVCSASVEAYISDRDKNSLGLESEWSTEYAFISERDCIDDVEFTLNLKLSDEDTDSREFYVFAGNSCDESDDTDDCDADILRFDADETSLTIPVSWIVDIDDCSDSDSTSVWVGLLESASEKEDNATWSSSLDFDLDGSPPAPPFNITTSPGEDNLYVSWEYDSDDDYSGFLILFAEARDSGDAGVDGMCLGDLVAGETVGTGLSSKSISGADVEHGRVKGLQNGVTYQIAVSALDESGNPSVISEVVCDMPVETIGFSESYVDAGGATSAGEYCFIATAAFGGYDHPVVRALRRFRDNFLVRLPGGRTFVAFYYRVGPLLVERIHNEKIWRIIRALLTVFSGIALLLMVFGPNWFLYGGIIFLSLVLICVLYRFLSAQSEHTDRHNASWKSRIGFAKLSRRHLDSEVTNEY